MPQKHVLNSESAVSPVRRLLDDDDHVVEENEGWLISYVDVLTLLVTLFVLLLSLKGTSVDEPAPQQAHPPPPSTPLNLSIPNPLSQPIPGPSTAPPASATAEPEHAPAPALSEQAIAAARAVMATSPATPVDKAGPQGEGILPQHATVRPMIDGVAVSQTPQGLTFRIQDRLLFASAEADLTDAGREVLRTLLPTLERLPGQISVEGHTDSQPIDTPRFPSNWELSSTRATAVLRYLEGEGIKDKRLRAIGYADTQPLASNETAQGRAKNRRVELVIQTQQTPADK